ncbi:MAG: D-alanyl-D-alanine carboxypeptidase family protein, partial [Saprospiraceae bacterium]
NEAFMEGGAHANVYAWLTAHASAYGFCQPYTALNEKRPNGYHEERWHWSYMPLAGPLLAQFQQHLGNADLTGFKGAEYADTIQVVQRYVSGINPNCK